MTPEPKAFPITSTQYEVLQKAKRRFEDRKREAYEDYNLVVSMVLAEKGVEKAYGIRVTPTHIEVLVDGPDDSSNDTAGDTSGEPLNRVPV